MSSQRSKSRMFRSQRELSVPRQCRKAPQHFNTQSARKAGSPTKSSSAILLLRPALTDKSLACAISRGLSLPLAITRSTAGWAENQRRRLRFTNSQAQMRSPLPTRFGRKWPNSNSVFRPDSTTRLFTTQQFLSVNRSTKCRKRCSKRSLVVLVVLIFLQNWRAAIIPLIAIPVSFICTFAAMKGFGFSINNLSLFGIVLAIGIVVDDAIVVVEAIEHHIEDGLSPRDAARKAMTE